MCAINDKMLELMDEFMRSLRAIDCELQARYEVVYRQNCMDGKHVMHVLDEDFNGMMTVDLIYDSVSFTDAARTEYLMTLINMYIEYLDSTTERREAYRE